MATDYNQATQDALNEQKKQLTQQIGQFGSAAGGAISGGQAILGQQQGQAINDAAHRAALVGGGNAQSSYFTNPINSSYNEAKGGLGALGQAIQQQLGSYKDIYSRYIGGIQGLAQQQAANPSAGLTSDQIRTKAYGAGTIASQQQAEDIANEQKDAASKADEAKNTSIAQKQKVTNLQQRITEEQAQLKKAQDYENQLKKYPGGISVGGGPFTAPQKVAVNRPKDIPSVDPVGKLSKIVAFDQQQLKDAQGSSTQQDQALQAALQRQTDASNKTAQTPAQLAIQTAIAHGVSPDVAVGLFADTATKENKAAQTAQYDVSPRDGAPTINDIAGGTKLTPDVVAKQVSTDDFNKASDEILKNAESGDATKADFNKAIAKYAKKNPTLYKVLKYSYSGYFGG